MFPPHSHSLSSSSPLRSLSSSSPLHMLPHCPPFGLCSSCRNSSSIPEVSLVFHCSPELQTFACCSIPRTCSGLLRSFSGLCHLCHVTTLVRVSPLPSCHLCLALVPVTGLANVQQTGSQPACRTQHLVPPLMAHSDSGQSSVRDNIARREMRTREDIWNGIGVPTKGA